MERWVDIIDYENIYQISNYGRIKRLAHLIKTPTGIIVTKVDTMMKITTCGHKNRPYKSIGLYKNGVQKRYRIHQLMYYSFNINIKKEKGMCVDHIDNNQLNNNLENLQLITHRENVSKDIKKEIKTSKILGVYYDKNTKFFKSKITINKKTYFLGCSKNQEDLKNLYSNALSDWLNFNKLP